MVTIPTKVFPAIEGLVTVEIPVAISIADTVACWNDSEDDWTRSALKVAPVPTWAWTDFTSETELLFTFVINLALSTIPSNLILSPITNSPFVLYIVTAVPTVACLKNPLAPLFSPSIWVGTERTVSTLTERSVLISKSKSDKSHTFVFGAAES